MPKPPSPYPAFLEDWVLPYVRDPALQPVLLALLGHVVVVLVPLLLAVHRYRDPTAAVLLTLLAAGSAWLVVLELRDRRRPAVLCAAVVGTWLAGFGAAWGADRTGLW